MPKLCDEIQCTGCASCFNTCPTGAITMKQDVEGFLAPRVDSSKCRECALCERSCPIMNPPRLDRVVDPIVYACWNNDEEIRRASSSGGMFSVYASKILDEGGVVFGAAYDDSMKVVFSKAESKEDLTKLRTSKYVQAEVGTIYRDVKAELQSGRPVLFVGTSCQVGGLYGFLGKDYENLVTCDLICYGAPSPTLYDKWLKFLEKRLGGKIVSLNMRGKQDKCSHLVVVVVDSRPNEPFVFWWEKDALVGYVSRMFVKSICLRKSCACCSFAKFPRIGDITLGDFWGIGSEVPFERSVEEGVSLNLINSEKGARLVELCQKDAEYFERSLDEAQKGNPRLFSSTRPHPKRDVFLRDVGKFDYQTLARKYKSELEGTFLQKVRNKARRGVSDIIRLFLPKGTRSLLKKALLGR